MCDWCGTGTQSDKKIPHAFTAAYGKLLLAFVFLATKLLPSIAFGYSPAMDLLVNDEFVAKVGLMSS